MLIWSPRFDLSDIFDFFEPKSIRSACKDIFCFLMDHLFWILTMKPRIMKSYDMSHVTYPSLLCKI